MPVVVAGTLVLPGDVVVAADDDVVVAMALAEKTAELARQRVESEAYKRERLRRGELSLDVMNLRRTLETLGGQYIGDKGPTRDPAGS